VKMSWKKAAVFFPLVVVVQLVQGEGENDTLVVDERDAKQGIFSVVSFPNLACNATGPNLPAAGLNGTCMTISECNTIGGKNYGSCARGFGTCCFLSENRCGAEVKYNRTYITNEEYPDYHTTSTSDTVCNFRFLRQSDDTCSVRLDFQDFVTTPPEYDGNSPERFECVEGETDYITISHADNIYSDLLICGYNVGQHVYIDMGSPTSNPNYGELVMKFDGDNWSSFKRRWNILVSYIDCGKSYTPPRGCEKFYYGNGGTGTLLAFNYDQPVGSYAGHLNGRYTICIRREQGKCQITYVPPDYDQDDEGFSINGNPNSLFVGRSACRHPSPVNCRNHVRLPLGTLSGGRPFLYPAPPVTPTNADIRCDRFCGRRLCQYHQGCTSGPHMKLKSRVLPFQVHVTFYLHGPISYENRGFKLNYAQEDCDAV